MEALWIALDEIGKHAMMRVAAILPYHIERGTYHGIEGFKDRE